MLSVGIGIFFTFLIIFIIAIVFYPRDTKDTSNLENELLEERVELDVVTQIRELNLFPSNAFCPGTLTSGTCTGGFLLTYHSLMNSIIYIKDSSPAVFTASQEFKFDSAEDFIKGMQCEMGDIYTVTIHNLTAVQIRITAFDFPTFPIAVGAVASLRLAITGVGPNNFTQLYKVSVSRFF